MKMVLSFFVLALYLESCVHDNRQKSSINNYSTKLAQLDSSKFNKLQFEYELNEQKITGVLANKLGLYNLKDQKTGYELRLWTFYSMMEPSKLYILKGRDSTATIFGYKIYRSHSLTENYLNPTIDTVIMNSLKPINESWNKFIQKLDLDSLFSLKTQSEIHDNPLGAVDGWAVFLEINDSGKYKYLYYPNLDISKAKDVNHIAFIRFHKRFMESLLY